MWRKPFSKKSRVRSWVDEEAAQWDMMAKADKVARCLKVKTPLVVFESFNNWFPTEPEDKPA